MTAARRRPPLALVGAAAAVVALVLLPLGYLAVRAVSGDDPLDVLLRDRTLALVGRTLGLALAVTASCVALGVPAAWLCARSDLRGRRAWTVALALPLVLPSYVTALALIATLGPGGFAQEALGLSAVPSIYGFFGAWLALTLASYPYVFLLALAGLRRVDPALEDAARSLGRSRAQVARAVTLPLLRPSIAAGALLVCLYALSDFGVVSLMRFDALTRAIYGAYRSLFDRTPAAVLGLVLVVLTTAVLVAEAVARGRAAAAGGRSGAARPALPVALGRWRAPAVAFLAALVGLALVLPVGVLTYWVTRGGSAADALGPSVAAAGRSLAVAAAAAALAVACALPVATLAVRYPRRGTRLLERGAYVANALPGVVVALALVFFGSRVVPALYGGVAFLVVAYVVRFLPQALSSAETGLRRVDPRLEEAARGLGASSSGTLARVTLPLLAPGLLAGATLVFLSAMKELPATLLLRPIGFDTLAVEVWTATGVSAYGAAAVPALALVVLSAPIVLALVVRGEGEEVER